MVSSWQEPVMVWTHLWLKDYKNILFFPIMLSQSETKCFLKDTLMCCNSNLRGAYKDCIHGRISCWCCSRTPHYPFAKTLAETEITPWVAAAQMCWKTTNAAKHKDWNRARQTILWISGLLKHFGTGSRASSLLTEAKKRPFTVFFSHNVICVVWRLSFVLVIFGFY